MEPYRTNPKRQMGLNSITKFTPELCERAGIEKLKHGKHSNQGGRRFAISKMASKGVSAAENMGVAWNRNVSVNVVYQDSNGDDRLSRLQAFRVKQQMLASNRYKCNSRQQHNQLINRCKLLLPPKCPLCNSQIHSISSHNPCCSSYNLPCRQTP
jgi:hypothetical protein